MKTNHPDLTWVITALQAVSLPYLQNIYDINEDSYPDEIMGYVNIAAGDSIAITETGVGDVSVCNGRYVILWADVEKMSDESKLLIEHAPGATLTPLLGFIQIASANTNDVEVVVHEYVAGYFDQTTGEYVPENFIPTGKIYLEAGKVYDCPKFGEEAIEFLYGSDEVYITASTLQDLIRNGLITISG